MLHAVGKRKFNAACMLVVLGLCAVLVPDTEAQAPSGPRFGENYALSAAGTPGRGRDVPGLAVNPANQNHIVEADANPTNLQCDYRVSFDGGQTWSGGHLTIADNGEIPPFPTPACTQNFDSGGYAHFNTGIVFGSGQNVYITFSAHRGPFNRPEGNVDGGAGDDAVIARSTDGGLTFQPAVVAVPGGGPVAATNGLAGEGLRPQIAVQRAAGAGGMDRLYVASWHCTITVRASQTGRGGCSGGGGERRILVARSDNNGQTWTPRVLASAGNVRAGAAALEAASTDEQAREPSQPVIGPDGAIYVAYRNRDITDGTTCPVNPAITNPAPGGFTASKAHCIVVARSTDQGQTWSQFSTNQPVSTATLSNPRLAIDPATPAGIGTLYVVYQRPVPGDPSDITIQSSSDRGQTWSSAVRVNDDAAGNIQTNPNVSVGPAGRVDVVWGDRRHTYPGGAVGDTYYARSTNGAASFQPNRRITDRTFNLDVGLAHELGAELSPGFSWYGPVSLPLPDGRVLAAWTDSRSGNVDSAIQDIYLSRLNPSAAIGASTLATGTAPGLSVVLSRLAYPGGTEALGDRGGEPVSRVVVANQDDVGAALAGAVLARARWGPLLLSPAGALPPVVKAEAARMRPVGGYLIGDTSTLSTQVGAELTAVTRDGDGVARAAAPANIPAANQPAELARRVAELMAPLPGAVPEAVIVNPSKVDAVTGAALAAALRLPILFVDDRTSTPPPTTAAITSLGIKKALIVGNETSVRPGVQTQLTTLLGAPNVTRLSGADQYGTSEAVLVEARLRGLPSNVVYVADGSRPIDAAVLGAAVGRLNGLMLLVPGGSAAAAESRLVALGIDAAVDRVVSAVGTGGADPVLPAAPPAPPAPPPPPPPPPPAPAAETPIAAPSPAGCPRSATPRNPIVLTNGPETRTGTALGDLILAGSGGDVIDALAGADCVDLGPGNDRGQGGAGDDFLQGGTGNDRMLGASGKDRLRGHRGDDRADGGSGDDSVVGGPGHDTLAGGSGNDRITGDSGRDRITGSAGRDTISARDGQRDRIACGSGRDRVTADRIDTVSRDCERVSRR